MTAAELRDALHTARISQSELARRLGLEFSTVNRWTRGVAPVPQYAVAYLALLCRLTPAAAAS